MATTIEPRVLFRRPSDDPSVYRVVEHNGDVAKCKAWVMSKYPDAVFVYPNAETQATKNPKASSGMSPGF